ncbi:hypothetical protein ACO2Q8_12635 [Larkinella sp. VNQ87]|uniref:hypothetical protein n=1 Tax=Larkinella sp. VNQ87 TaxID=3400921 RepID=UPI003C026574
MTLTTHRSLCDETFLLEFESTTLDKHLFTHEAHIRLAWLQFRQASDFQQGLDRITTLLRLYAIAQGAPEKYHQTITVAFCRIIYHRMQESAETGWLDFLSANEDLADSRELLSRYYSAERLMTATARVSCLEPDLSPLPHF